MFSTILPFIIVHILVILIVFIYNFLKILRIHNSAVFSEDYKNEKISKQIKKAVFVLLLVGIGTLILWAILSPVLISAVWSYFFGFFIMHLNLNIWLIRIISSLFAFVFIFFIWQNVKKLCNPVIPLSKKQIPALVIVCFLCGVWFVTYLAVRDHNFDAHGRPLTHMAWTGDRYEAVASHFSVHPVYGTPVIRVTPENISAFSLRKIEIDEATVFFSPVDGTPLIYYYVQGTTVDFFNSRGTHPRYGGELLPVTPEFIRNYFLQIEIERRNAEEELARQRELRQREREEELARQEEELIREVEASRTAELTILLEFLYIFPDDLGRMTQSQAIELLININAGNLYGYNDWRLPTAGERGLIIQNRHRIGGTHRINHFSDIYGSSYYLSNASNRIGFLRPVRSDR